MSPPELRVQRRLTMVEAHTTLGQVMLLRVRAFEMSDEALAAERSRLAARAVTGECITRDADLLWYAVVYAEQMRRTRGEGANL